MKTEPFSIETIPAILYGDASDAVWLFIHGKCGRKEEAAAFAEIVCPAGAQVLSVDLPEHGQRQAMQGSFNPWTVVPELRSVLAYGKSRYRTVSLRANSIGAYFSMLAFAGEPLHRALLVSPIVDMKRLISDMMTWAGVGEAELQTRGEIPTDFGETLSWQYLSWVRAHPPEGLHCPTSILYAGHDNLTSRETITAFAETHHAALTVVPDGEHWFHTPEQLCALADWERSNSARLGETEYGFQAGE